MPKILTEKYLQHSFFIPLTADKSEGLTVKPLSGTMRSTIRKNVLQEAGHDAVIAEELAIFATLKACIQDWKGFYDAEGADIPYTETTLKACMECNPELFKVVYQRILSVAAYGELEQTKN